MFREYCPPVLYMELHCEILTLDVDISLEPERMVSVPHACLVVFGGLFPCEGGYLGTWVRDK